MKKVFFILSISILLLPLIASAIELNLDYPSFGDIDINKDQELGQVVAWFYYLIVGISGLAAFTMLVFGGIQWLSSAGNPGRISDAKSRIQNALLGLLLILGSFLILQIINPELTILKTPGLDDLEPLPPGITNVSPSDCAGLSPSSTSSKDPFGSPVKGKISSLFGYRGLIPLPGGGTTKNPCHTGIDIAENGGEIVKSPADGNLIVAFDDASIGLNVVIQHENYQTRYAHLRSFGNALRSNGRLSPGIFIPRGSTVGTVGETGEAATGEHLHYEISSTGLNVAVGRYNPNLSNWGVCGSSACGNGSTAVPIK